MSTFPIPLSQVSSLLSLTSPQSINKFVRKIWRDLLNTASPETSPVSLKNNYKGHISFSRQAVLVICIFPHPAQSPKWDLDQFT